MADKDVSAIQIINIIYKRIFVFLWQKMKTRHKYILELLFCICLKGPFVHFLDCSQKCLSQAVTIHGFTMDMEVTIGIKKLKPPNFSFAINF